MKQGAALALDNFLVEAKKVIQVLQDNTKAWWGCGVGHSIVLGEDGTYSLHWDNDIPLNSQAITIALPILNEDEYTSGDITAAIADLQKEFERIWQRKSPN